MSKTNLTELINDALASMKALDIVFFDVRKQTSITDHMVICSGTSNRQVKAIAQKVIEDMKQHQVEILGTEGLEQGLWVLIDLGDAIVHVMHPDSRSYYQLEKLWSVNAKDEQSIPVK